MSRRLLPLLLVLGCSPSTPEPATATDQREAPSKPTTPTPEPVKPSNPEPAAPDTSDPIARSINAFSFDLYGQVAAEPGNLIVSPASVAIALGMTANGAQGPTAAEFDTVLHTKASGLSDPQWHAALGKLVRSWTAQASHPDGPSIDFSAANRLFVQDGLGFLDAFITASEAHYAAPVEPLNFAAAEQARAHINGWVEQQTHDRIVELIPSGGIDASTRLVLVNALYFRGDWLHPFSARGTKDAPFHVGGTEAVSVPTMYNNARYPYAKVDGASVVQMPYWRSTFAMTLVVPDAVDGLPALEARLSPETLAGWVAALKPQGIGVALPKFKLEPSSSLALSSALKGLGLTLAFSDRADFGGILPESEEPLKISEVFHKGFIEVDERGTEAAAATAVAVKRGGGGQPDLEVEVDRPFLFFIRDTETGATVFMGRVVDPR